MKILGLDLSLNSSGVAIVDTDLNKIVHYQTITHKSKLNVDDKLIAIYKEIDRIVNEYEIDTCVIEDIYSGMNKKTYKLLAFVHSVVIMCLKNNSLTYQWVTTNEMKKAVLGKIPKGVDLKKAVAEAVFLLYPDLPKDVKNDITDAIALTKTI